MMSLNSRIAARVALTVADRLAASGVPGAHASLRSIAAEAALDALSDYRLKGIGLEDIQRYANDQGLVLSEARSQWLLQNGNSLYVVDEDGDTSVHEFLYQSDAVRNNGGNELFDGIRFGDEQVTAAHVSTDPYFGHFGAARQMYPDIRVSWSNQLPPVVLPNPDGVETPAVFIHPMDRVHATMSRELIEPTVRTGHVYPTAEGAAAQNAVLAEAMVQSALATGCIISPGPIAPAPAVEDLWA